MNEIAIIAVGTSQGGLPSLRALVMGLSSEIPAAICVVQHIGARRSHLPEILTGCSALPVTHAVDDEPTRAGQIYVAPPDHHLLVMQHRLRLSRGPRQNWTRPAIDPLFRCAAEHFGPRAIGVLLSGRLNDGTAGLYEIKQAGGVAIVQDPKDAAFPAMPLSALYYVDVDFVLPAKSIGPKLNQLAQTMAEARMARVSEGS